MNLADIPQHAAAPAGVTTLRPRTHVIVGGWVRNPLRLDADELEQLHPRLIDDFVVVCTLDGGHGGIRCMRGVPLQRLILEADPAFEARTDFKRVAVVAEAHDGYRALFSWGELFHTPVGDGVLVAFDSPTSPLPPLEGPFALVSRHDRFTGPRFVRNLGIIELVRLW